MDDLEWSELRKYYYGRRKNKVPEDYYSGKFKLIKQYFKNSTITYDNIDDFFAWLDQKFESENGRVMSNSYRNKFLHVVKVCARLSGTNVDEYKGDNEEEDRKETEKLTLSEYEALMKTWIKYDMRYDVTYKNFFDLLLIEVAVITTQRPGNLSKLEWKDYFNGYLHFTKNNLPKNRKAHAVYLPPQTQLKLSKLRRKSGFIFTQDGRPFSRFWFNDMLKERCKLALIEKNISPKSLRGTGATQYLKKYGLHQVAKITGHKDVRVLANHYYDPENKEIEEIIEDNPFHPEPINNNEIRKILNETMERLNKRGCQSLVIERNGDYLMTTPKVG